MHRKESYSNIKSMKFTDQVLDSYCKFIEQFKIIHKEIREMDKLINKVSKDVNKGKKKEAQKDIKVLKKADKKFDKALDKCGVKH
jgi:seryl-tRNA synthetase